MHVACLWDFGALGRVRLAGTRDYMEGTLSMLLICTEIDPTCFTFQLSFNSHSALEKCTCLLSRPSVVAYETHVINIFRT